MYDDNGKVNDEPFSLQALPLGTHVSIAGTEDLQTHVITAKRVELFKDRPQVKVSGVGMEDRAPTLAKDGSGWRGIVYADGYEIVVDPKTDVQLPQGVTDTASFNPNLWAIYHAKRQNDASILATQLSFMTYGATADEQKFREKSAIKIEPPDYEKNIPGAVRIIYKQDDLIPYFKKTFQIIPDRKLQETVNALGQKLVPEWQRELPDSNSEKLHFHFYVVKSTKLLTATLSDSTGNIFIPAQILPRLQNEAQLAYLLSIPIAATIEKDAYRSSEQRHSEDALDIALMAVPLGYVGQLASGAAFRATYWIPLIEHEYRIGLRYMIAAGYDPREAPLALKRSSEKHPDEKVDKSLPSLASYVDAELGFDYMATDFTTLHKGETEYAALQNMALAADPDLRKEEPAKTAGD